MYFLYDMAKLELLVKNESEKEIYKAVCNIYKTNKNRRLLIKRLINNGDLIICSIRNEEDFINYLKMYEEKLLKMKSCIELKREILDLTEKTKKLTKKV